MGDIAMLCAFIFCVFAVIGLQLFVGTFHRRCTNDAMATEPDEDALVCTHDTVIALQAYFVIFGHCILLPTSLGLKLAIGFSDSKMILIEADAIYGSDCALMALHVQVTASDITYGHQCKGDMPICKEFSSIPDG